MTRTSWIPYAGLLVLFWGVWGAFSGLPAQRYGYPDEMIYAIWALTMLIPCVVALRGVTFDRRGIAARYGLVVGLTGAGGQLLLFKALTIGPAYLIVPLTAISPAITVLMAVGLLRERLTRLAALGVGAALVSIVLFSISGEGGEADAGLWLPLTLVVAVAWGVQAFYMKKAATVGVNDGTTFAWMTISALALVPVAILMMGGLPSGAPWQAPALTAGTQLLNAVGALFLVMALSRGKAAIVAPSTNALFPVLAAILSLVALQRVPNLYAVVGIVLAVGGSALMVYADESSGEDPETAKKVASASE